MIRTLTRRLVGTALDAARLPLHVLQRATGNAAPDWGPTLLFDGVDASVRQAVGGLLGDSELVRAGQVARARIDRLREAQRLEAVAGQRRRQAQAEHGSRLDDADARREEASRQADEARGRAEAERRRKEREAAGRAEERRGRAEEASEREERLAEREARRARGVRAEATAEALDAQRDAVEAAGDVVEIEESLQRSRRRRAAGS